MPVYQLAHYQVEPTAVEEVTAAIEEFVDYVSDNEPGSRLYAAWQQQDDPTRFVHVFIFADEAAHQAHGQTAAVRKIESVYTPHLVGGPVVFTDYAQVATNQP